MTWFDDLAERLRTRGMPADHVEATLADLAAHLEESGGADPEAEFGPAEEFARELAPTGSRGPEAPDAHVETWRWTADTYVDEELLNRFGGEGWEVERVDALGRFVSHRDLERPQRWEYRRELVTRGREGLDERLAPDGWEACGNWLVYAWFKRPVAASLGPDAEISEPPEAPGRGRFFSGRFYLLVAFALVALVLAVVTAALDDSDSGTGLGFAGGAVVGALVPLAALWGRQVRRSRR
ncbi:hypothetical protein GCM10010277_47430 [Streptomyces longisporoflavus]|uniref:hypothetical protein n=1 Tax=Streptomyces longisporoflavus TaxID=28044 RepID=UPI00167D69F4|nr:hypothetical protein [Streptomyces longisporoflavus]GGV51558.1 hypothetical protein GCM10010277_47430 [Streptomyces longisporoflavus]